MKIPPLQVLHWAQKYAEKSGLVWNQLSEDQKDYWLDIAHDQLEDMADVDPEEYEEEDR